MKNFIVVFAFVILAGCGADPEVNPVPDPECQEGIEGVDGNCYIVETKTDIVETTETIVVRETDFLCPDRATVVDDTADCPEEAPECETGLDCEPYQTECFGTTLVGTDGLCYDGVCVIDVVDVLTDNVECGFIAEGEGEGEGEEPTFVVSLSTPPTSGTFVKGTSGVPFIGLLLQNNTDTDVTVTALHPYIRGDDDGVLTGGVVENDIVVPDHISQCSLFDGESGALLGTGPLSNDEVLLEGIAITVVSNDSVKVVLKCNLSNVDVDSDDTDAYQVMGYAIQFDPGTNPDLQDLSSAPVITVVNNGGLTVSRDGATANSTIILGASTGVAMSKHRFTATDEAYTVQELTLRNCVTIFPDTDDDCADLPSEIPGADDIASVVRISYQNQAGATVTKAGFLSNGSVTFSGLDFFVPQGTPKVLTVTIDTNTVGATGATSGDRIQLNLDAVNSPFEAIGAGSGETLTEADLTTYIVVNPMTIRKTKPTISLASGSPSGFGIPGLAEVFRFNVAADSRGFVTLDSILFKVSSTDNELTPSGWNTCGQLADPSKWRLNELFDSEELADDADISFLNFFGVDCDDIGGNEQVEYVLIDFRQDMTHPPEEIGAGNTTQYVLRVDTTGASSNADDSIRIDIPDDAQTVALPNPVNSIVWEDDVEVDSIGVATIGGSLIKNLPVFGGTIVY